jgi:putative sterol carrier protein
MSAVSDVFTQMAAKAKPENIQGMNATYQFVITGADAGEYFVKIANGTVETGAGRAESNNIELTMADETFLGIVSGKVNGQTAFLTGKLKIKGDMTLAMRLGKVLGS